jgi:hypothetical protein
LGKRGRPATGKMPKANFRIPPEILAMFDGLKGKLDCESRSDVLRKIVLYGYPVFKMMDKSGGKPKRADIAELKQSWEIEND